MPMRLYVSVSLGDGVVRRQPSCFLPSLPDFSYRPRLLRLTSSFAELLGLPAIVGRSVEFCNISVKTAVPCVDQGNFGSTSTAWGPRARKTVSLAKNRSPFANNRRSCRACQGRLLCLILPSRWRYHSHLRGILQESSAHPRGRQGGSCRAHR